jgi:hypothetical protein
MVDSFLSRVWYRAIRCRFGLEGVGVERSLDLPLSREEIALVMLALAEGRPFTPVQIQKALFLAADKVADAFLPESHYDFQPYDYGPFDRDVYVDLENLEGIGCVKINRQSRLRTYSATQDGLDEGRRSARQLSANQLAILERIVNLVRSLSFNELVSAIYKAYPPMRARSAFKD